MGNLCSIFHDRHDRLKLLSGSPAKAEFLSKCIYWWQISTYKIKNSQHTWFTRTTEELATKSGLSESSVTRYLSEYVKNDLIEKRVLKRYSKKHGHEITCLHIRISEKLQKLLMASNKTYHGQKETTENCNILTQIDDTGLVNLTTPYNKENKNKINNSTVRESNPVNSVDKTQNKQKTVFSIEKELGERITDEVKNQVKGMMVNVLKQGAIKISNKEQVFAEIIFSLLNPQQFQGIDCFKHKINIIASLLKNNAWKTPLGFYNHWDIGKLFKEKMEVHERKLQEEKIEYMTENINLSKKIQQKSFSIEHEKTEYEALNSVISKAGEALVQLEKKYRFGDESVTQQQIEYARNFLENLWVEQKNMEQQYNIDHVEYRVA